MFSRFGLALMLREEALVAGRSFPAGAVGTEEDFGDDLERLLRAGMLIPFDPAAGVPPIPTYAAGRERPEMPAALPTRSYAYAAN
jgi:hypothetical protein